MFKSFSIIPVLLFVMAVHSGFSQTGNDTIVLLNGNVVVTNVIDTTNGVTNFKNPKNPKKNFIIENDRIFSIKNSKGESIMYVYDTLIGNEFTIEEMRYFIRGEQDAEKGFKAHGAFYGNMAVGAAAGFTGSFLCPIAPFAFTALSGLPLPKVKIKKGTVSNPDYLNHEPYLLGYDRVARKKRKIGSLIGGGIGLGVGLCTYFILKGNHSEPIN